MANALLLAAALATAIAASPPAAAVAAPAAEGVPAPPGIVREIQGSLAAAVQRFQARDVPGVLAHVSDGYRTGPFTKPIVREQLLAIYGLYDAVRATIRIDEVRIVGDHAWVYTTGELSGRLRMLGTWTPFLTWQRELEVARREGPRWRLFGYQQ
jgi:hypothetical protein